VLVPGSRSAGSGVRAVLVPAFARFLGSRGSWFAVLGFFKVSRFSRSGTQRTGTSRTRNPAKCGFGTPRTQNAIPQTQNQIPRTQNQIPETPEPRTPENRENQNLENPENSENSEN
jgi:hypothetical protein